MKTAVSTTARLAALGLSALLASTCVLADKGGKHGQGNKHENEDQDRYYSDDRYRGSDRHDRQGQLSIEVYFGSNDRRIINDYYGSQFRAGNCPPGLAKKHNGCMPPGQARKWRKGQPLPQGLAYYPLPADLVYRLPPAPPRHQYVRVASDILLIAVGTSMVVDAIQDIGR
jgi:Ni/Co efflux regulator RcnB